MAEEFKRAIEFVELTWMRAFRVWWSFTWRTCLFSFLGGLVVGFVLGFILGLVGINPATIKTVCQIAGAIVSIPIGITVIKVILKKRFSDFRIALIKE